jgi:VCBS repeat-containing protein
LSRECRCALRLIVEEGKEFHMATYNGTDGNDVIIAGNGGDTLFGNDGDDVLIGGNAGDILVGGAGNDTLDGRNGADHLAGGGGNDLIDGGNGFDTVYYAGLIKEYTFLASAGYLHIVHQGGAGADGHDQVIRVERLVFADRTINLGSGANLPVAADDHVSTNEDAGTHNSGSASVLDNDFDFDGDAMTVTPGTFAGAYGTLTLNSNGTYSYALSASAQALALGEVADDSFSYTVSDNDGSTTGTIIFHVAGLNDAPTADADTASTGENDAAILIDVLANDDDVDNGAVLTVTAASAPAGQGSASVVDNQVEFDPGGDFESLALGESVDVLVGYDISDEHGATASSTVTVTVTGANDGPVANPDTDATTENATILIDAAANDTDVDNGAVLAVSAASAPSGQGSASAVGGQVEFNPGTAFDDLKVGETEEVIVNYTVSDEHGATSSSTVTITVTGTNDGPVANPDTRTTSENSAVVVDVLANDVDVDHDAVLNVVAATGPAGQGTVTIVENQVRFDPGTDFAYLGSGETAIVVIDYTIEDEFGVQSSSTLTITVQGREEGSQFTGTADGDTLIGTPGDDTMDGLGGDDQIYGQAGADLIFGGDGNDFLNGEEGDDVVEGGNNEDVLSGGDGNDQLLGQAGSDNLAGEEGEDQLSGGTGADQLSGDAGNDILDGGSEDDFLSGGEGTDQLSGQAGNDVIDGGEGDDDLGGGGDQDYLSDFIGTNSFAGGLGDDTVVAGSTDGAQTIDGGDGNDVIRHYYRSNASTITTGAGSDTIEIAHANVGTAAIVVTDFTAGAGGDKFRLSGDDGALLSLLSGWDGSSNPFGSSGFLRLQQDGDHTWLQWDQDGGGDNWETLVVFENTDATAFTDANFDPPYHPDGSPPAGETITGTNDGEALVGTVGSDTIDALGGDDTVSGLAGADIITGGDGFDQLHGDADDDVIDGGNDDDFLFGGDGGDDLLGQAGSDALFGDSGGDTLAGGDGNDNLDGGDGDDDLDGGGDDDFLSDFAGTNSLAGGLGNDIIVAASTDGAQTIDGGDGNDVIRHYYRSNASTITTGAGSDTIEIAHANVGTAAITVTDFTAGAGGDVFRLSGDDGALLGQLSGWDGSSNPFGSGFLRLEQSGTDTLFQWDQDGSAGGENWETLVVFENTDANAFTAANFTPGYDPDGSAPAGETITGTENDDVLAGTVGADTINALAGNDVVHGNAGADLITGGDGFDQLHGEGDGDVIDGGNDDDYLWGDDGNDDLSGGAGNDALFGDNDDDDLSGGDGNDNLDGGDGADTLLGGNGEDFLIAGLGLDVLTGNADADTFYFQLASNGPDEITDFAAGADKILISAGGFGGGLFAGATVSLVSGSDPTASETSGQFLYDTDDGSLFWDADGTGSGEAVLVATFTNIPSLEASDFIVAF